MTITQLFHLLAHPYVLTYTAHTFKIVKYNFCQQLERLSGDQHTHGVGGQNFSVLPRQTIPRKCQTGKKQCIASYPCFIKCQILIFVIFGQVDRSRKKLPLPPPENGEGEGSLNVIAMYDFTAKEDTDLTIKQYAKTKTTNFGFLCGRGEMTRTLCVNGNVLGLQGEEYVILHKQDQLWLCHPKLVQLYGVCLNQRPLLIVAECMDNGCLLNYLRQKGGTLKDAWLLSMCQDVCEGMDYLEAHNFIHRDLRFLTCLFSGVVMWEIFSQGQTPFDTRSNLDVVNDITKGIRLYRPHRASQPLYAIMYRCWHEVPHHTFTFNRQN
ncbi:hypothetical protein XENOCAPTIV_016750 [Xenoophorus captivus]|uniref:Protein kinase domain-containing protein n=1 Tax=Xenoophorus captivus TaxID=1517983 RepID=A0ABV0Q5X6_9TELE